MPSLFSCPICGGPLEWEPGRYVCPSRHSFDLAREGYVNLLPANRQHSKAPGDDKEMAAARTRFLEGGWYSPLRDKLTALVRDLAPEGAALLDAGCGEGWYTASLTQAIGEKGGRAAGVDLSKPAVKKAARRCSAAEVAVASVYHLPLPDASVDVLVNCFSPLAIGEFCRVVKPGGWFLYVVPGPRHLWELKEVLYDNPYENEEKAEEYPGFSLKSVEPVETVFTLTQPEDIAALFHMTPYTWKTPRDGAARLAALDCLSVTAQFRIHIFQKEASL